jgi:hypothetical protein
MTRIVLTVILVVSAAACTKKQDSGASSSPSDSYLTVGAYCTGFCSKLCGTCGQGDCDTSCKNRCYFGRSPDLVMDGKNPKQALALTQKELDGCTALITKDSCMAIASGQVPPACFTIQH